MADKITDGLKHDGGKPRLDLVPPEIIEAVGAVMTHGAEKYGEASYKDVEPKRYRAALMRHICKWLKDPYGKDEDSGLPHLWHIACNVAFLLELDKPEEADETTIKGVWFKHMKNADDFIEVYNEDELVGVFDKGIVQFCYLSKERLQEVTK